MKHRTQLALMIISKTRAGDGDPEMVTQAALDSAVAAAVAKATDDATTKMSGKNAELLADLKKAKTNLSAFDGMDADKFKSMMGAFENDQDMKDIADGKYKDVIERKLERERADFTSAIEKITGERDQLKTDYESTQLRVTDLMIKNNVVSEFVKEKGVEGAIPDVILRAKSIFKVEGEETIARNEKGEIITGENGPLTIKEFIGKLKNDAPHLFPSSSGSGAQGGGQGGGQDALSARIKEALGKGDQMLYRKLRGEQRAAAGN